MQKTRIGHAGSSDINSAATSATDALNKLAESAERLNAQLSKVGGGGSGTGSSGGSGGAGQAADAFFSASSQASGPAGGQGGGSSLVNGAWGSATANMFLMMQQAATPNPSRFYLRDAQGRFASPDALTGGAGGTGGAPPASTSVGSAIAGLTAGGGGGAASSPLNPFAGAAPIGPSVSLANAQYMANASAVAQNPLNPFAGAAPQGPATAVGAPGFQFNSWQFQQQQTRAQQMAQVRAVGIGVGVSALSGGLNAYASNTASGEYDPMQAAGMWGQATGAVAGMITGAIIGSVAPVPEPGLGALIGSGLGAQLGSAAAQAAIAPQMRTRKAVLSLTSISARQGVSPYQLYGNADFHMDAATRNRREAGHIQGGLEDLAERITNENKPAWAKAMIKAGIYTGTDIISGPQIAETYATFGSALLSAGEDPSGAYSLTERTARKYKMLSPQMAQMAAPLIGAQNKLGRNSTDLLMAYGPEAYGAAADALGGKDLTKPQLQAYGQVQQQNYALQKAALGVRGVGQASVDLLKVQGATISALPQGEQSLAYAQNRAALRDAGRQAFDEKSITSYGIPMAKLSGEYERAQVQPYSPTNMYRLSLRMMKAENSRIGQLSGYMADRKKSGQLSETEELDLTQQIESAKTNKAKMEAQLSEGVLERMPAMLAGGNRYSGRFTTPMLAAMALHGAGNNSVRAFGAANGRHLKAQDDFYADDQGDTPTSAHSRTQAFNAGGAAKEQTELLRQIRDLLSQSGKKGGGGRADESLNAVSDAMRRAGGGNSGGGFSPSFN